MNKLFTITISFSDHLVGIVQCEVETPLAALKNFIKLSESLEGYDRDLLIKSIMPLVHYAGYKGVWGFHFDPELEFAGPGGNHILGGQIIQTDPNGPIRSSVV